MPQWRLAVVLLLGRHAWGHVTAVEDYPSLADVEPYSVVLDGLGQASLVKGEPPAVTAAAAWGRYADLIHKTGWSVLDVHTNPDLDGERQSYAAGFLEGALSQERMAQHLSNMWGVDFAGNISTNVPFPVRRFMTEHMAWMKDMVRTNDSDPYWRTVGYLLAQLRGLTDGYNAQSTFSLDRPALSEGDVVMFSMLDADLDDLVTAVAAHGHFVNGHYLIHESWRRKHRRHHGHCSALVQAAPGNADLWAGHVTWDEYRSMIRVVKYLDMPLPGVKVRRMAFTSNPGNLYSADDFYNTDAGLTIIETSIQNFNHSAEGLVTPKTVFTWARAMVANRLATNGDDWTELELRHQSGTCNNQWMVVDFKRFTPGEPLRDGTLWVSEAMPGYSRREDATHTLVHQGSWPSFNIPYFKDIWVRGGYEEMENQAARSESWEYSFKKDPRGEMFERARRGRNVTSFDSFRGLLRYNNWHADPLARGDACNGISARCDLNRKDLVQYDCFGAIDGKVVRYRKDSDDLSFLAVSSPSHDHYHGLEPFQWSAQNDTVEGCRPSQHHGHPDTYNFGWYELPSTLQKTRASASLVAEQGPADRAPGVRGRGDVETEEGAGRLRAILAAGACGLLAACGLLHVGGRRLREASVDGDYIAIGE